MRARIQIVGIEYVVNLVVLAMTAVADRYQMLLGQPWLRDTKVKHDWKRDRITLKKGKRKVKL